MGGKPVTVTDGTIDTTKVALFNLRNPVKQGDSNFTGQAGGQATGTVKSGSLEGSGVDPARAMVDLMASMRSMEATQRAITTIDTTLQQTSSQVGEPSRLSRSNVRAKALARAADNLGGQQGALAGPPAAEAAPNRGSHSQMLEGMYTAAAGMAAQQSRLDAVANDLANASTTGYKSVRVAYRDLAYTAGQRLARRPRCASARAPRRP